MIPRAASFPRRIAPWFLVVGVTTASLAAQHGWLSVGPAHSPPARAHAATAMDLARGRMVVFGGDIDGGNTKFGDTWTWDGVDWQQHFPNPAPLPRNVAGMAYDSNRRVAVLFGGVAGGSYHGITLDDTWEWDGATWTQRLPATVPSPRAAQAIAYDPLRGEVVMFGGTVAGGWVNGETWVWNGLDWQQRLPAIAPAARFGAAMAFDAARGELVLYGGLDQSQTVFFEDTWTWDGSAWHLRPTAHQPPGGGDQAMVYQHDRQRVLMLGGLYRADVWEWDGSDWSPAATLPVPLRGPALAYDPGRAATWLFGGEVQGGYRNQTLRHQDPDYAFFARFGTGCAGSFGSPRLAAVNRPLPQTLFDVEVTALPPDHFTTLWLGFSRVAWQHGPLPYDLGAFGLPGCQLYVSADYVTALLNWNGVAHWCLQLPNDAGLLGLGFHVQVGAIDRVNALGMVVSEAGEARIGSR